MSIHSFRLINQHPHGNANLKFLSTYRHPGRTIVSNYLSQQPRFFANGQSVTKKSKTIARHRRQGSHCTKQRFGLRWQSAAATSLSTGRGISKLSYQAAGVESGVALRFPLQSKSFPRRRHYCCFARSTTSISIFSRAGKSSRPTWSSKACLMRSCSTDLSMP